MLTPHEQARTERAAMQPGAMLDARCRRDRAGYTYVLSYRSDLSRGNLLVRHSFPEFAAAVREAIGEFRAAREATGWIRRAA